MSDERAEPTHEALARADAVIAACDDDIERFVTGARYLRYDKVLPTIREHIAAALKAEAARVRGERDVLMEVHEAARAYSTYDDLRGDLCEVCKPNEPEAIIAARERLADALDTYEHIVSLSAPPATRREENACRYAPFDPTWCIAHSCPLTRCYIADAAPDARSGSEVATAPCGCQVMRGWRCPDHGAP